MTNEERVLHGLSKAEAAQVLPWRGKELKRFWAVVRRAGVSKDGVRLIIEGHFPGKSRLHDLTRGQFIYLMDLFYRNGGGPDQGLEERHGNISGGQWRKIRWLQRRLGWSDRHLTNYICKLARISHIRFLTAGAARAAITGMEKMDEK
jgi:hypothetical protein